MKSRHAIIGAAALAAAFSACATDRLVSDIRLCDGSGTLVISADSDSVAKEVKGLVDAAANDQAAGEQLVKLLTSDLCAQRGQKAGSWLLAGTQSAMQVGVVPYGTGSGLYIASPRDTFITLLDAHVEGKQ